MRNLSSLGYFYWNAFEPIKKIKEEKKTVILRDRKKTRKKEKEKTYLNKNKAVVEPLSKFLSFSLIYC